MSSELRKRQRDDEDDALQDFHAFEVREFSQDFNGNDDQSNHEIIGSMSLAPEACSSSAMDKILFCVSKTNQHIILHCIFQDGVSKSLDITRKLPSKRVAELQFSFHQGTMKCTFKPLATLETINIYFTMADTTSCSLDVLRWCLGDREQLPWLNSNFFSISSHKTAEMKTAKSLSEQLLDDIATNREDDVYSRAQLQAVEEKLRAAGLETPLRQYQLRGILWLQRHMQYSIDLEGPFTSSYGHLDGWVPLTTGVEQTGIAWYSLLTGQLSTCSPQLLRPPATGAILADFMGLGKSVQILGLILLSLPPRPPAPIELDLTVPHAEIEPVDENAAVACTCSLKQLPYATTLTRCKLCNRSRHNSCMASSHEPICFTCVCKVSEKAPLPSGATLLILPRGLISQWLSEIRKHIPSSTDAHTALRVFVYEGVAVTLASVALAAGAALTIDPRRLAANDIVIVALDTLRDEVHLQSSRASSVRTRRPQVYDRPISPLVCINWRILVVDETQKIEGEGSASRMSMLLNAQHRFVVSGTPLGHFCVDDLQYLLKFFRIKPFDEMVLWRLLISNPLESHLQLAYPRLVHLMRQLMLRRRRIDVEDELNATTQTELVQYLNLSSFEQMEYDAREKSIKARMPHLVDNYGGYAEQYISTYIEELRKCCCHPRAFMRNSKHNPLSFDEIIVGRAEKLGVETEDEQRKYIYNLTGLAGCLLIESELNEYSVLGLRRLLAACSAYWIALQMIEKSREVCDVIAMGTLSEAEGDYGDKHLYITSKAVRADAAELTWMHNDDTLCPGPSRAAIAIAESITSDYFTPFTPTSALNVTHEYDETAVPAEQLVSSKYNAKIEFSSSKRLYAVGARHQLNVDALCESLADTMVYVQLFAHTARLNGGPSQQKSMTLQFPSPIAHSTPSTAVVSDTEAMIAFTPTSLRSKLFAVHVDSFYSTCILHTRNAAGERQALITTIDCIQAIAAKFRLQASYFCAISLRLRGALFDCDIFQELHVRENLALCLKALDARYVHQMNKNISLSVLDVPGRERPVNPSDTASVEKIDCLEAAQSQMRLVEQIKSEYVLRAMSRRLLSGADLQRSAVKFEEKSMVAKAKFPRRTWWQEVIALVHSETESVESHRLRSALMADIRTAVTRGQLAYLSLTGLTLEDLPGVISSKLDALFTSRRAILDEFNALSVNPTEAEIHETSNCMKCCETHGKTGPVCSHCRLQTRLHSHTAHLFAYRCKVKRLKQLNDAMLQRGRDEDHFISTEHNEHEVDGGCVMLLRELRKFVSSNFHQAALTAVTSPARLAEMRDAAKADDERLAVLQSELKVLNTHWLNHQMLLFAYDDLNQAATTIKLMDPMPYRETPNGFIAKYELSQRLTTDYVLAVQSLQELNAMVSKMRFIRFEDSCRRTGTTVEQDCVICQCELDADIRMLPCLHAFHESCIMRWILGPGHRKCPLCQSKVSPHELVTVENQIERRGTQPQVKIIGDYGTKLNVLIGDLLKLGQETEEKAIVFSQWSEVLQIVGAALQANGIRFSACYCARDLSSSKGFKAPLDHFKSDVSIRVLLIPLSLGADGLSIIEATHVFLLEPLVNETIEMQAVARVARIGQENPTHVHKYILLKTIEDKIHREQSSAGSDKILYPKGARKSPSKNSGMADDKHSISLDLAKRLLA